MYLDKEVVVEYLLFWTEMKLRFSLLRTQSLREFYIRKEINNFFLTAGLSIQ